jgi:DNA polymerase
VRPEVLEALGLGPAWVLRQGEGETRPASAPEAGRAGGPVAGLALRHAGEDGAAHARFEAILRMDWDALEAAVAQCNACPLARTRTRTVFGVGDRASDWLFVGEGPGADEDWRGEPFVGQAGRLLDAMLAAIGLERGRDVFIANVVKCRPPGNRNPEPAEAGCCMPFLQRQVELIRPRLIVALGKVAAVNLLGREVAVAALRGRLHDYRGIPLLVTYHPAYLLRNLPDKARAWEDLCLARDTMAALKAGAAAGD